MTEGVPVVSLRSGRGYGPGTIATALDGLKGQSLIDSVLFHISFACQMVTYGDAMLISCETATQWRERQRPK